MSCKGFRGTVRTGTWLLLVFLLILPVTGMFTGCSERVYADTEENIDAPNTEVIENLSETDSQVTSADKADEETIKLSQWLKCIDDLNRDCLENGFTYDGSCSTATYQAALQGSKKTNCAKFLMWALNRAEIGGESLLPGSKTKIYTSHGRLKGEDASYMRDHPERFRIIQVRGSVPALLADGTLKRGDIIGYRNRLHTECYIGKTDGKYKFLNYGPSFRSRKGYSIRTASECRKKKNIVGIIIRIKSMDYDDEKPENLGTTVEQETTPEVSADLPDHTELLVTLELTDTLTEPSDDQEPEEEAAETVDEQEPADSLAEPSDEQEPSDPPIEPSDEHAEESIIADPVLENTEDEQAMEETAMETFNDQETADSLTESSEEQATEETEIDSSEEQDPGKAEDDPIYKLAEPDEAENDLEKTGDPEDGSEVFSEHASVTAKAEHLYRQESSETAGKQKTQNDSVYQEGEGEPHDTAYDADRRQASDIPGTGDESMILPYLLCCIAAVIGFRKCLKSQ